MGKKPREKQNAPFPYLLFYRMEDGFIFHRILSKIVLVNLSVFSKACSQATSPAVSLTKNNGRIVSLPFEVFDLK